MTQAGRDIRMTAGGMRTVLAETDFSPEGKETVVGFMPESLSYRQEGEVPAGSIPTTGEGGQRRSSAGTSKTGKTASAKESRHSAVSAADATRTTSHQASHGLRPGRTVSGGTADRSGGAAATPLTLSSRKPGRMFLSAVRGDIRMLRQTKAAGKTEEAPVSGGELAPEQLVYPGVGGELAGITRAAVSGGDAVEQPVDLRLHQPPIQEGAKETPPPVKSDYISSLPDWAQRFLRENPAAAGESQGSGMGVSRSITTVAQPQQEMVSWTAPDYPQQPPAQMSFRESGRKEESRREELHMSDAEIRRAADKVYELIEDRIRRERRLLGF